MQLIKFVSIVQLILIGYVQGQSGADNECSLMSCLAQSNTRRLSFPGLVQKCKRWMEACGQRSRSILADAASQDNEMIEDQPAAASEEELTQQLLLVTNPDAEKRRLWENAQMPYQMVFEGTWPRREKSRLRRLVRSAMRSIQDRSCFKFPSCARARRNAQCAHIKIVTDKGCHSEVGRSVRQPHVITLGSSCTGDTEASKWRVAHVLLHAMGFWHESSRQDRDQYVNVNMSNVQSGLEHNYAKVGVAGVTDLSQPYDYESVMHLGARSNALDHSKDVITPKRRGIKIGQETGLSDGDYEKINLLYKCGIGQRYRDAARRRSKVNEVEDSQRSKLMEAKNTNKLPQKDVCHDNNCPTGYKCEPNSNSNIRARINQPDARARRPISTARRRIPIDGGEDRRRRIPISERSNRRPRQSPAQPYRCVKTSQLSYIFDVSYPYVQLFDGQKVEPTNVLWPNARAHAKAVTVNGKIYIIGGGAQVNDATACLHTDGCRMVEEYDPNRKQFLPGPSLNRDRLNHAVGVVGAKIYVCGGNRDESKRSCEILDTKEPRARPARWTEIKTPSDGGWGLIWAQGIGTDTGMHVVGGFRKTSSTGPIARAHWTLTADRGRWSRRSDLNSVHLLGAGVALLNDTIYVCGGYDGYSSSNACESMSDGTRRRRWNTMGSLVVARHYTNMVSLNGKLYVLGGRRNTGQAVSATQSVSSEQKSIEVYDPESDKWQLMKWTFLTKPTSTATAVVINQ